MSRTDLDANPDTDLRPLKLTYCLLILIMLPGCGGNVVQNMLRPAGRAAAEISEMWWLMFGLASIIFVLVLVLLFVAIRGKRSDGPPLGFQGFIVAGGVAMPAVVLLVLLVLSVRLTLSVRAPESDVTIEVVGHMWWWEVRYPDSGVVIANELYIPAGRPVRLQLTSQDVIHSFWVPALHGKMDMIPRHTNEFWIEADTVGLYRGQCAEFCGTQHAFMALWIHALAPEEFDRWVERRRNPETVPASDHEQRGFDVFMERGCFSCHAIEGTAADGTAGPALTDIGSRLTLGAGTIPNSRTNLGKWIINSQAIKPGNLMPNTRIAPNDLEAMLDYLNSLN